MERTLVLIKPDAMQRGLAFEILQRFERRGLKLAALRLVHADKEIAAEHYAEHVGKGFYDGLINYITACPIIAAVFEGTGAVAACRPLEPGQAPLLQVGQLGIEAAAGAQFGVGALLDQLAALEHQDPVSRLHGGQSVGDHNRGAAL